MKRRLLALGLASPALAMVIRGQVRPPLRHVQSMVVLGTAQYDGVPSRQFAGRLRWASELWQRKRDLQIITVGGKLPGDRYTEAEVAREYLVKNHVAPGAITVIDAGLDTWSSFEAIREQIRPPMLIVTDPLHASRSELMAWLQGIRAFASPTPHSPTRFPSKAWWVSLAHELGGMLIVGVTAVAGRSSSTQLEDWLRSLEAQLRPRRQQRSEQLRQAHQHAPHPWQH